jgi:hypothetical protein
MLDAPAASTRSDDDEDDDDDEQRQGENFTLQTGEGLLPPSPLSLLVIRCSVRNPLMIIISI